jgi:rare lipoprotein A
MKKHTSLFILLVIFGFTYSQVVTQKKLLVKKDTISKTIVDKPTIVIDTMVVPKGKYKPFKKLAHASYYAEKFTGRKCASGRIFDNNKYYAAHKSLPFGTKLKVTNERNGKTVYVEVVDRGPFVKGRELDLSHRAFRDINPARGSGAVIVTIEILQK